ncbi:zinc-binding dehydrogenase [Tsukamurella pseudospumae]|uniref:L-idonate 5-dehydrogenase n=1 Tax=Tsukamurella pseudospumae TaxID=239498 RepID=A0A138A466_9ACTN|nr:zinc-binding dehydrogenase [Tsukamurella pseudospumae]KXO98807.1 L-idonate 5-dehydrogenase [Tsukamurella pseudospumae]KXP05228.1 L-idonate 5-dehydrogenase [Tsukamurella pseudospumae]
MTENLGVVAHAAGDLRVQALPEPEPTADEAVIAIAYGGVCGSDLHYWLHGAAGTSILRAPLLLGHEVIGTVERAAADGSGPAVGTPVAVHPGTPHGVDGVPYPAKSPNLAPAGTYLGSAAHFPHCEGAFARRVALPTRMLRILPANIDPRDAALIEPAAVAWHGVARAGDVAGKRVAVIGAGPIGLLAVAVALHHGAATVVATDIAAEARERALALGAAAVLDARESEEIAALHADVVIESSGTVPGLHAAVDAAGRGGIVVMLGLQRAGDIDFPAAQAITRELDLRGALRFNDEIDEVIAALADGSLNVRGVVTHVLPAADALEAFEIARDSAASGKVLLDFRT